MALSFSLQNIKLKEAKSDATPPSYPKSQKKEISIDLSLSWTRTPRIPMVELPSSLTDGKMRVQQMKCLWLAEVAVAENPLWIISNRPVLTCVFVNLNCYHLFMNPPSMHFFPSWLLFILIDPVKEPGASYILEIRKGNHSYQKEEI